VAANKVSAVRFFDPGGRMKIPGGDVVAATASLRWVFVLSDLLLPRRIVSGFARESVEKSSGDGRRRAPASSRWLLLRSGKQGMLAVASVFSLEAVDGKQRRPALRSDGVVPRPTSPIGEGVAGSCLLLRSTKEQISDGISSELESWFAHLFLLRRRRRWRRWRLRSGDVWLRSKISRALFVFSLFLGVLLHFPGSAVVWIVPELGHVCCNLQLLC
jgi:hypothetical protein